MTTQTRRRRFNVDEYYAMAEVGILTEDDRVELLDGEIFAMAPMRWRFTVEDYYAMAKAGILAPDERVELLNGEIIAMAPIGSRHASSVDRLTHLLTSQVGQRAVVRVQSPVRLNGGTEPQPDLMLLKPHADFYSSAHPGPGDVLLLIEVSDTTVDIDRYQKLPTYARAGVSEFWIVNLLQDCVEVYTEPTVTGYGSRRVVGTDGEVSPAAFPDILLPVRQIIPA